MSELGFGGLPKEIVLEDGRLNEGLVCRREILYRGNNGRCVERFYLSSGESYIFKPLTNNAQFGKEVWVHEQILPHFPAVFPKIISYQIDRKPEQSWMILEDLGPLSHTFSKESLLAVVRSAAVWHSLPLEAFAGVPLTGMKPRIGEMVAEIQLGKIPFSERVEAIFPVLYQFPFSTKQVVCHGDLHQGNYALVDGRLAVLDWEHAHLNLPYWDLYHAIDMSHPDFSKKMTCELREEALNGYLDGVQRAVDRGQFKKEYYRFAAVFSMWMLILIERDLRVDAGKWPQEQLERQREETADVLEQLCECILKS
ncbi:phosphotransferase [Neobacillus kokaensis]|uniref:Aminoglycoside phosphotransferase domain-containing protein n=1 Tax=Neobacillus kokaensis TaxID=2759023 RepID=A0ABQ3MZD7_9BACI|nr:phosphotransferase [Neobacillus kokaensis]GHH98033.1 hypothetical protein AM1BK_15760 [Neobacillus kokaensis]